MKVHPRLAMELARHSDMRLTMKTYTGAGQLPLREVMDSLPGFGADSRIDSRNLGARVKQCHDLSLMRGKPVGIKLAERGGFEPPIRLRTTNLTISKQLDIPKHT